MLSAQFEGQGVYQEATLSFRSKRFFQEFRQKLKEDRRAEVAFAVERKNGKIIVIRTSFYPKGIYRIPTGGICFGETVLDALYREIAEELGVQVDIKRFLGTVEYRVQHKGEELRFASFVFWLKETGGSILTDATEDEICEFIEVDAKELQSIVDALEKHQSGWRDWCLFRMQSTAFILPFLEQEAL